MILITRGDTCPFSFTRVDKTGEIIQEMATKIYFTVKKDYNSEKVVLQKTIGDMSFDNGTYHFTIEPEDTNGLEYGLYVYDLEVITDEYKQTISKGPIRITEEVTFESDEV